MRDQRFGGKGIRLVFHRVSCFTIQIIDKKILLGVAAAQMPVSSGNVALGSWSRTSAGMPRT
jgi:hypothetical protein